MFQRGGRGGSGDRDRRSAGRRAKREAERLLDILDPEPERGRQRFRFPRFPITGRPQPRVQQQLQPEQRQHRLLSEPEQQWERQQWKQQRQQQQRHHHRGRHQQQHQPRREQQQQQQLKRRPTDGERLDPATAIPLRPTEHFAAATTAIRPIDIVRRDGQPAGPATNPPPPPPSLAPPNPPSPPSNPNPATQQATTASTNPSVQRANCPTYAEEIRPTDLRERAPQTEADNRRLDRVLHPLPRPRLQEIARFAGRRHHGGQQESNVRLREGRRDLRRGE